MTDDITKSSEFVADLLARVMRQIAEIDDPEEAHKKADKALCDTLESLGCGEGVKIYKSIKKYYS